METEKLTLAGLAAGGHSVIGNDGRVLGHIEHGHLMNYVTKCREELDRQFSDRSFRASQGSPGVDAEVLKRSRELMGDEGLSYSAAFKRVLASDRGLADRYHAAHSKRS